MYFQKKIGPGGTTSKPVILALPPLSEAEVPPPPPPLDDTF
jgi:hypothetical protein